MSQSQDRPYAEHRPAYHFLPPMGWTLDAIW